MKRTFRKILAVLFSGALLMAAGCGAKEKIVYSPALPGEAKDDYTLYLDETFNSTADLSDCQGYRNWYYYCGDPEDDSLSLMVFNDYYGRWCSEYQSLYYYTYMWSTVWLPEDQQGYGIGMGFKAPASGKVSVSATVRLLADPNYSNGDGVVFTISDKSGDPYDGKLITPEEGAQDFVLSQEIDVEMGDEILFMLFPNSNNTHDYTNVDITVKYLGA